MSQKGFATWKPTGESAALVSAIEEILDEYRDHLPLTGRQIFYRLVAAYGFEKSERGANRLYGVLGRARRSGMISFTAIRDGGGSKSIPQTYDDLDGFWAYVRKRGETYARDRQAGQRAYIELFCEAPGMMPQLQRVAFRYGVPVYGTRGFTGLGVVADTARRALRREGPTVLLQVGDYDPSGVAIFRSFAADVESFVEMAVSAAETQDDPEVGTSLGELLGVDEDEMLEVVRGERKPGLSTKRVALTWEQVVEHDLPTAPPAKTKRGETNPHGYDWVGETAQAEAMPPDLLADVVTAAIENELDMDRYWDEVAAEKADRRAIDERLPGENDEEDDEEDDDD